MPRSMTRRGFLRTGGALAATTILAPSIGRRVLGANERLGIAGIGVGGIGVGGKGESDIRHCASEDVVALCDIDLRQARGSLERFPGAARYRDFRKMLGAEDKRIDAVTVSTRTPSSAKAERFLRRSYRKGWELEGV